MSGSQESESSLNDNIISKSKQRRRKLNDDENIDILADITNNIKLEDNNTLPNKNTTDIYISNDVVEDNTETSDNYLDNKEKEYKTSQYGVKLKNSHSNWKPSVNKFPKKCDLPDKWEHDKFNELEQMSCADDESKIDKSPIDYNNQNKSHSRNNSSLYNDSNSDVNGVNNIIKKIKNVSLRNKYNNTDKLLNDKNNEDRFRTKSYQTVRFSHESYDKNKVTQIRVKVLDVDEINARIQSSYLNKLKKRYAKPMMSFKQTSKTNSSDKPLNLLTPSKSTNAHQNKYRNYKSYWKSNQYQYSQTAGTYNQYNQNSQFYPDMSPYYYNSNKDLNINADPNLPVSYDYVPGQNNVYNYQDDAYLLDPYSMDQSYYESYYQIQNEYPYYAAPDKYL